MTCYATNEDIKNLDRRAAVPASTRALLRRARGLDLEEPTTDAEYVTQLRPLGYKLQRGETFAGFDFDAPVDQCVVVLELVSVNYPVQGYPEAYEENQPGGFQW